MRQNPSDSSEHMKGNGIWSPFGDGGVYAGGYSIITNRTQEAIVNILEKKGILSREEVDRKSVV